MYVFEEDTAGHAKTPTIPGFVSQIQHPSRRLLIRDDLEVIVPLIVGQHHGDTVSKGEVLPGDVKPIAALARPRSADAGPDFLAGLVFACGLAVVDEVGR